MAKKEYSKKELVLDLFPQMGVQLFQFPFTSEEGKTFTCFELVHTKLVYNESLKARVERKNRIVLTRERMKAMVDSLNSALSEL